MKVLSNPRPCFFDGRARKARSRHKNPFSVYVIFVCFPYGYASRSLHPSLYIPWPSISPRSHCSLYCSLISLSPPLTVSIVSEITGLPTVFLVVSSVFIYLSSFIPFTPKKSRSPVLPQLENERAKSYSLNSFTIS